MCVFFPFASLTANSNLFLNGVGMCVALTIFFSPPSRSICFTLHTFFYTSFSIYTAPICYTILLFYFYEVYASKVCAASCRILFGSSLADRQLTLCMQFKNYCFSFLLY